MSRLTCDFVEKCPLIYSSTAAILNSCWKISVNLCDIFFQMVCFPIGFIPIYLLAIKLLALPLGNLYGSSYFIFLYCMWSYYRFYVSSLISVTNSYVSCHIHNFFIWLSGLIFDLG